MNQSNTNVIGTIFSEQYSITAKFVRLRSPKGKVASGLLNTNTIQNTQHILAHYISIINDHCSGESDSAKRRKFQSDPQSANENK